MPWERPPGKRAPERGGPPQSLEEIARWLWNRYKMAPSARRRPLYLLVAAALLVVVGLDSYYIVEPQETAVVQRFGKYVGTTDAGLHFKIPFGIETVQKVVTGRVLQREYGYRTLTPDVRSRFVEKGYEQESLMLSGDLNVVNLQWTVQYKVNDPVDYLFKVSSVGLKQNGVEATLDDISESVMRRIVGNRYADEVLTVGRASIADQAKTEIQKGMNLFHTGVQIVTVKLQNANPPDPVKAAFNEVNEARQEKERMINDAQQAYNQQIPKALGEARQTVTQAEGYALERVNRSQGEIKRFLDILAEYEKAPDITRRRMYIDSFQALMGRIDHLYVIDQNQKSLLPLFDLGNLKPSSPPAASTAPKKEQ